MEKNTSPDIVVLDDEALGKVGGGTTEYPGP